MVKALIVLTCLFTCTALGAAVALFAGTPMGIVSGTLAFMATQQMGAGFARRSDRRNTQKEIAGLRKITTSFDATLTETRSRMDDLSKAIEAKATAQGRKIVAELQVLESLMREFAGKISSSAARVPSEGAAQPRARGPAGAYMATLGEPDLLETIRASLEENRVDLYLQPIVSLPQRKLRFYEALSRLRSEDGAVIMPAQYIKVAAPAGLMSVVDNLLLFRCVQIVRRLTQKHRDIGVFCNISGDTLMDAEFFPQFIEYMRTHRDLVGQIVFEFEQAPVLKAGEKGEKNLTMLAGLGFALSMDHVQTLALDFARLKNIGFRHLKVRAETLLSGMDGANAAVAAEDFKKLLERHGLNLIAERVEDEKTVVQLLDYGVDFAQGYLFGEPRAVRDNSLKPMEREPQSATVTPLRRAV